jgi:transposase
VRWGRWKKSDAAEPADHALGRSRGGFTTKIHILCDGHGLPLHFHLTAGQTHESSVLEDVLAGADERLLDEDGERVAWPFALGGDKGYRAAWIDEYLLNLGMQPVIPSKENEDRAARPVEFDREAYRRRNIVERLIGWLKESRRVFSRFEKTATNFAGMITLACIRQYLRYELV